MDWDTNLWEQRSCSRQARLEEAHDYRPFHRVMLRQSSGEGSARVEAFPPQASSRSRSVGASESQQLEAHRQPQEDESQVKEFKGKILKSGGRFVLEESSNDRQLRHLSAG